MKILTSDVKALILITKHAITSNKFMINATVNTRGAYYLKGANIPDPWLDNKHVSYQVSVELSTQWADDSESLPTWLKEL